MIPSEKLKFQPGLSRPQKVRLDRAVSNFPAIQELMELALPADQPERLAEVLSYESHNRLFADHVLVIPQGKSALRIDLTFRREKIRRYSPFWIANAAFYLYPEGVASAVKADRCVDPFHWPYSEIQTKGWNHATQLAQSRDHEATKPNIVGEQIDLAQYLKTASLRKSRKKSTLRAA